MYAWSRESKYVEISVCLFLEEEGEKEEES